jgi:hypothetical protein
MKPLSNAAYEHRSVFLTTLMECTCSILFSHQYLNSEERELKNLMSPQTESDSSSNFTIALEIVPEDPQQAYPALVDAIGRDTVNMLRNEGYALEPVYTGQRGGFLVDVIVPFLNTLWTQKDTILADGGALVTIFTPVVLIAKHLQEVHKKRAEKSNVQQSHIKLATEIDGAPFFIEAPDLETTEAAMSLARRFQAQHPTVAAKVTNRSNVKIKASVPRRQPKKRR